ncbi:MAG: 8-oxoguanine deaminase [Rhizobiales bacterium 65-9]|nr:8-oxoguanine deaminase [Hyphomicrobiales bacterium]OJY36765.1 MAG: 8-oxoguanine deaminase [Rhizobiales bacterium 65-9]
MSRFLLLSNALVVATMDDARREISGGSVLVEGGVIAAVGPAADVERALAERTQATGAPVERIDLAGHVALPGLINTHHHMYQTLTRALPAAQDAELFGWLRALYPVWARMTPDALRVATMTACAELVLSGCTTSSDHAYVFPNGCRLDDTIEAARAVGIRFHATRGAMSLGESSGGLPPDDLVESEDAILADTRRVIELFHDAAPGAMLRVGVAPCSPFSVTRDLMRESAALARSYGVSLHTHLAENDNDVAYSLEKFGQTPADYVEALGWVGPDVWHAHCVKLDDAGMRMFGRTGTGVAHCPCSNMRLASGVAPVRAMRCAGVPVGLGVDGSASNDGAHMLGEARQAMLLQRVGYGPSAMSAREALEMATLGGARLLGRNDIGALKPGMAADIVAFDVGGIEHAGALRDPVAALMFCAPARVALGVIDGRVVAREGRLETLDLRAHAARHNALATALANGER